MAIIGSGNYSVTSGSRTTAAIAAGRRVPQFEPKIFNISENVAPMIRLLAKMKQTRDVESMTFLNMTGDTLPQAVTHAAETSVAGTQTINLASGHGARVHKGTVLQVPSLGLEMLVTADPAADQLTGVTRPYGATSDGTIASGEEIQIIGMSATEGDTAPRSVSVEPNILTQYCQEFRTALQVTDRAKTQAAYGGDEWQRLWDKTMEAHLLKVEKQLKLGLGISGTDPFETGGFLHWIATNKFTVGGTLTEDSLNSYIEQWMRRNYGQTDLAFFAGSVLMNCFGKYGRDSIRYNERTAKLGIAALEYQTVFGNLTLIPDAQLTPIGSATTAANLGYQGYGLGMNLATLGLRYFKGNHRKVYQDILKDNRPTSRKDEVAETVGLHIASEVAQMWIQSVTG